jgi:hypothetical protein
LRHFIESKVSVGFRVKDVVETEVDENEMTRIILSRSSSGSHRFFVEGLSDIWSVLGL